jgi:hypothetical protein
MFRERVKTLVGFESDREICPVTTSQWIENKRWRKFASDKYIYILRSFPFPYATIWETVKRANPVVVLSFDSSTIISYSLACEI